FNARRLVGVSPSKVESISVGNVHEKSGRTLLTINVECEITLEGEFSSFMHFYGRKMVLGKEAEPVKYVPPERATRTVTDSVRIEATAKYLNGQWADLQFIDFGEWWKLQREINPDVDR